MTTAVPTNGFSIPQGGHNIPPAELKPGYVKEPAPAAPVEPAAAPVPASTEVGLGAAIAALTAALGKPPEAPVEAPAAGSSDLNTYDVAGIDDPIIRSMATVLQTTGKGLDLNRAIGLAIERGDPSLVDASYLREAGGANAEQLITIATGIVTAVEAKANEVTSRVHTLAGGEANWSASTASFNTAAPSELRLVVKQMLDSQRPDLIEAGAKIVVEFSKSSGLMPKTNPSVQQGAASMPSAMALDKFQFQEELAKLNPTNRQFPQQRAELFARRQLGKRLGK